MFRSLRERSRRSPLPAFGLALALASLTLSLAGCVGPFQHGIPIPQMQGQSLLRYYEWLQNADAEALALEQERLAINAAGEMPRLHALRRGLLLLARQVEDVRLESTILTTFEETAQAPLADEALLSLVRQQLDLRRSLRNAQGRNASARAELDQLGAENARLQQQIDALTHIEQQLIERELQDSHRQNSGSVP